MKIKKINSKEENQRNKENVINQIKEIINSKETSLKSKVVERINYTD
jgi:hypothetical protein